MDKLSKDELFDFLKNFLDHENTFSYMPDLAKISLIINLAVMSSLFSGESENDFLDKCYCEYSLKYNHNTQITENKYLSVLFDMAEYFDERNMFEVFDNLICSMDGFEYEPKDLEDALIDLSIQFCNNMKLGLSVYENLISIAYYYCDKNKRDNFYNTCRFVSEEGRKYIDKNLMLTEKNSIKSNSIQNKLLDTLEKRLLSEQYINSEVPMFDILFVLTTLASLCLNFSNHQLTDFLKISINSFNENTEEKEIVSESSYLELLMLLPNYQFIYDFMSDIVLILKDNYNTCRMIDLTYALLGLAAIVSVSDKSKISKFRFVRYCYTIWTKKSIIESKERNNFEKELDYIVDTCYPSNKNPESIIEFAEEEKIGNKAPNTLN